MLLIKKKAIEAFLKRERDDYRKALHTSDAMLDYLKLKLPVRPPIWNKLKHHQRVCLLLGATTKRFAYFLDTGCGKTLLSIALARYFAKAGIAKCSLILVPRRVNLGEWVREIKKHSPKTPYCVLRGSSKDKWASLEQTKAPLVIATYAGIMNMVCERVPAKRGRKRNVFKPSARLVRDLASRFQGVYMDESTEVKNRAKLPYRICRQLAKRATNVFALTGTPFGRDVGDIWAQMHLVDNGQSIGETLGLFRAAFFTAKDNFWGGQEYVFNKKMDKDLKRCLAHRSIRIEADQADLPAVVAIKKFVSLNDDAEAYYASARKRMKEARGNYVSMKNAFLRMRQISSGFVGFKDDDSGEKAEFVFDDNPKLELLLSIIESIREDRKIVVFNEYIFSGNTIARELTDMKIKHVHVFGGTKDPVAAINKFNTDPKCRVLVLQNSMVKGLNVQVARYGIFYESPVSVIDRKQAWRRIERQHSEHSKVFIYDLVTRGTVDERILQFHKQGGDLFKALFAGVADL